jgi:mono/diheme cytochrome c family protein
MPIRGAMLAAVVLSLAGCGGGSSSTGSREGDRGGQVYGTHCAACHQRDGRGVGRTQPALAGSATVAGEPRKLIAWVLFGVRPETNRPTRSIAAMPQFAWLTDEDVAAVLTYVRSSFGNSQPAVTAAEVAEVRAAGRPQ